MQLSQPLKRRGKRKLNVPDVDIPESHSQKNRDDIGKTEQNKTKIKQEKRKMHIYMRS